MSSSPPSKISSSAAAPVSSKKMSHEVDAAANPPALFSLNPATRVHLDANLRERRAADLGAKNAAALPVGGAPTLKGLFGVSRCNTDFFAGLRKDFYKAKENILRAKRAAKELQESGLTVSSSNRIEDAGASPSIKRRRISVESTVMQQQINKALLPKNHSVSKRESSAPPQFLDLLWEESWVANPSNLGSQSRAAMMALLAPRPVLAAAAAAPVHRAPPAPVAPRANIPATVSDSFEYLHEEDSSRALVAVHQNTSETSGDYSIPNKEDSFGWFVETEEDDDDDDDGQVQMMPDGYDRFSTDDGYPGSSSTSLAFRAPTASKASKNHDAQVEWAKAADTIDDVLGDFF